MKQKLFLRFVSSTLMMLVIMASCTKQGPAGATGATGNANVIISAWTGGFSGGFAQWKVPAITLGVLDSSAILVYARVSTNPDMVQLPFASNSGFVITDDIDTGVIDLYVTPGGNLSNDSFRYVIIPQGVAGTSASRRFEEIMTELGIVP